MQKNIHFVSYGNNTYNFAKQRIKSEAINFGMFSSINIHSPNDIDKDFSQKYIDILSLQRGNGYWLWKEYFVSKKLSEVNFGDYVIYCDAGCTINKNGLSRFNEYIELLDNDPNNYGIISFQMDCIEEQFTTTQFFSNLNVIDDDIKKSGQHMATILIIKKCDHVVNIFNDFFKVIDSDHKLITDYYNKINQEKIFIDNRHDQSILSVIRKIKGSLIIPDETFYLNFNCEKAKQIPFLATRKRN